MLETTNAARRLIETVSLLTYDIRGEYPKELDESFVLKIGIALAKIKGSGTVATGRDVRESSSSLQKALIAGLQEEGCEIIDLGLVPNPAAYYYTWKYKPVAGVYVTASHLPPQFNGLKLIRPDGTSFLEELPLLQRKFDKLSISRSVRVHEERIQEVKIIDEYIEFLIQNVPIERPLRVVVDCFCGSASVVVPGLFENLEHDHEVILQECDPTPDFGGRDSSEPKGDLLGPLIEEVRHRKADVGVAFDGDADRAVFVDDRGRVVEGSKMAVLFALDLLRKADGVILASVDSTAAINEVTKHGGTLEWVRIGHNFIEQELVRKKARFCGEPSNHYYFADLYPFSDGILSMMMCLALLARASGSFSQIIDTLPRSVLKRKEVPFESHDAKLSAMKRATERLLSQFPSSSQIDGVRVQVGDHDWGLIRQSNTERIVRIMAEAPTEKRAEELLDRLLMSLK